jgi:hypothetical protein
MTISLVLRGSSQMCAGVGESRALVLRFRKANILLDCAVPLESALYASVGLGEPRSEGQDAEDTAGLGAAAGPHPQSSSSARVPAASSGLFDLTPFLPVSYAPRCGVVLPLCGHQVLTLPHRLSRSSCKRLSCTPHSSAARRRSWRCHIC